MSITVRPINANLTHDTEFLERMDPYVKIYFGGQLYRTSVCHNGGKHPSWNQMFTMTPSTDSTIRVEVWDSDTVNDDLVGSGSFNLMQVYNSQGMRSDNQYIDLFYNGRSAGRILISFQLTGMNGYWGGQQAPMMGQNYGNNFAMNSGWNQPPPMMGGGYVQPMNNGWGNQPPMNNGWGNQPLMNNGWGNTSSNPLNNNGWNNMPPPNNGWGY